MSEEASTWYANAEDPVTILLLLNGLEPDVEQDHKLIFHMVFQSFA